MFTLSCYCQCVEPLPAIQVHDESTTDRHHEQEMISLLNRTIPVVPESGYDTLLLHSPARCLKGTRVTVLDSIMDWFRSPNSVPVYWVSGLAGIGKSTIARTIVERARREGKAVACFFFSRQYDTLSRGDKFIPSLSRSLADQSPGFRSAIAGILKADEGLPKKSLDTQFSDLFLRSLRGLQGVPPFFIVIDALDECDYQDARVLLHHFLTSCPQIAALRILITSRPEYHIISCL